MGLREDAEKDLAVILENEDYGGWPISLISPLGDVYDVVGQSGDIAHLIDPETGYSVSGRIAHASVRISTLYALGTTELPRAISKPLLRPWVCVFRDLQGADYVFKVQQSNPDRTMGVLTMMLEAFNKTSFNALNWQNLNDEFWQNLNIQNWEDFG